MGVGGEKEKEDMAVEEGGRKEKGVVIEGQRARKVGKWLLKDRELGKWGNGY